VNPVGLISDEVLRAHRDDAARVLEGEAPAAVAALLCELELADATALLDRLEAGFTAAVLAALTPADAAAHLAGLSPAAAATVLRHTAPAIADAVLAAAPSELASAIRRVLVHPARTAAALMDPKPPAMPRDRSAAAALAAIRAEPARYGRYVYVVARDGELVGALRLVDIIAAAPEARLDALMVSPVVRLLADDPEAAVLAHPGWARYPQLPVVEAGEQLVGVIRDDDVHALRRRDHAVPAGSSATLALSLAELFWLGMIGVADGVANVMGRGVEQVPAPSEPAASEDAT
jgi:Mg/Co/Ni transporter MgtE